jgi:hypothetical protein
MAARFAGTMKAIEAGLRDMAIEKAIKNIAAWEAHLEGLDVTGAKTVHADLGRLRRALEAEPINGEAVTQLLGKLAAATVRMADRVEGKRANDVRALGEALQGAVEEDDEGEDEKESEAAEGAARPGR